MMSARLPTHVLGVPLDPLNYETALERVKFLAREPRPAAVSACNTHLVAAARQEKAFGNTLRSFDLNLPDGMPLIWVLRNRGCDLEDRVYGPYFMRHVLLHTPRPWRHFFFGGSQACLDDLTREAKALQPEIDVAGVYSPPFRSWTETDQADFARRIQESQADFIWVALGGVRQEQWIEHNLHRFKRGVFLAVGDAFELLARRRKFAPMWMQHSGLTWLYRLAQEPRRLWLRYLRHNSAFIWYLTRDAVIPRAALPSPTPNGGRRIAFLGSRGTPARYAGFETVVEQLGARLVERGNAVTVYNRTLHYPDRPPVHRGMSIIYIPSVPIRVLETFFHTLLSTFHAISCKYDIIYLCGVGNSLLCRVLALSGAKVVINVDGIDFRRAKWRGFAKTWLRWSERWAVALADRVIADNEAVVEHYKKNYNFTPIHLSYGTLIGLPRSNSGELEKWGLHPDGYILFVGRLSPENEADTLIKAYVKTSLTIPLVIVGAPGYEKAYFQKLKSLADHRVIFTGGVFGEGYRELSQNCRLFVLPAAIEATRLVLLDQMGMGNAILFRESQATREVIGNEGVSFLEEEGAMDLRHQLERVSQDPALCRELGDRAQARAQAEFSWDRVTDRYLSIFDEMLTPSAKKL